MRSSRPARPPGVVISRELFLVLAASGERCGFSMLFRDLTKAQRRALRELAGLAHDRELSRELTQLEAAFAQWRAGKLDPHELNGLIHAFHQGPSRRLFMLYTDSNKVMPVAAAVARGVIAESEVPEALAQVLAPSIAFHREAVGETDDPATDDG